MIRANLSSFVVLPFSANTIRRDGFVQVPYKIEVVSIQYAAPGLGYNSDNPQYHQPTPPLSEGKLWRPPKGCIPKSVRYGESRLCNDLLTQCAQILTYLIDRRRQFLIQIFQTRPQDRQFASFKFP